MDKTQESSSSAFVTWLVVIAILFVFWSVVLGPISFFLALAFHGSRVERFITRSFFVFLIAVVSVILLNQLIGDIRLRWVLAASASPFMTYLVDGFFFVANFTKPKSLAEQLRIQQEKRREMDRALGVQATQKAELSPTAGKLRLGVKIKGDRFNNGNGVEENSGWLQFDQSLLDQHMFVLGATGAGKSETLKRIIYETLVSTDRDVFFIDGKGDASLAL
ncbi:MAG: DUF87 domain-containing protein, partial [Bacteroidota bacterium]